MLNVLVMGLGRGKMLAGEAHTSEQLRLAGAIDPDAARLRAVADELGLAPERTFASLAEALKATSAEMLVVATPTRLHVEHVRAGLAAGMHVLCEKPLTTDRAEAGALRDAARQADRQLAVVQNSRYGKHFRTCRELLAAGAIGELRCAYHRFSRWRPVGQMGHRHALLSAACDPHYSYVFHTV